MIEQITIKLEAKRLESNGAQGNNMSNNSRQMHGSNINSGNNNMNGDDEMDSGLINPNPGSYQSQSDDDEEESNQSNEDDAFRS